MEGAILTGRPEGRPWPASAGQGRYVERYEVDTDGEPPLVI